MTSFWIIWSYAFIGVVCDACSWILLQKFIKSGKFKPFRAYYEQPRFYRTGWSIIWICCWLPITLLVTVLVVIDLLEAWTKDS